MEKLFLEIIKNTEKGKFKVNPNMMNLLGSTKQNFYELIKIMNYKKDNNKEDVFFYIRQKKKKSIKFTKKINNPFSKLTSLNIK